MLLNILAVVGNIFAAALFAYWARAMVIDYGRLHERGKDRTAAVIVAIMVAVAMLVSVVELLAAVWVSVSPR